MLLKHACFPDDSFVFCYGNMRTVPTVDVIIKEFEMITGFQANCERNHIFLAGVDGIEEQTLRILKFQQGKMTLKFLGVSLISTKLSLPVSQVIPI